ncbi:hypothetical protein [Labrys sp. ZIDIC5]|uniref:hypothetical protein n=1 Tax=Labrys sedimenti TaxID=3106036 RepID=UPI002ACA0277|nr:hypothetical protein [Labrys sp. ZIDIC5]MDZ5452876.1 hypothetical protein [Labrys sp. ZIDIC5]
MNFKRKHPKSARSGCLLCKPWKRQGTCLHERRKFTDHRREVVAKEKLGQFRCDRGA